LKPKDLGNEKTLVENFSDIDLLIVLGNETLFVPELVQAANGEWDKRDLEDHETEALIKQIKDITEEGRSLMSRKKDNHSMATFLQAKSINEVVAKAYAPEIKGPSIMTIVGSIFAILIVIRLLYQFIG